MFIHYSVFSCGWRMHCGEGGVVFMHNPKVCFKKSLPANSKLEFYWQIRRNTWVARSAEQTDRALEVIVLYCWFITVFRGGVTPSIKQCHLVVESEKTVGYIQLNVLSQYQHMGIKFTHVW